jgi:ribosomal small subunit protein bTHX
MGKGDKKSKRGKIAMGSYGVSRPRKRVTEVAAAPAVAVAKAAPKAAAKEAAPKATKKKAS